MGRSNKIHFSTNCAIGVRTVVACGRWNGTVDQQSPLTGDINKVTCGGCKRTDEYRAMAARKRREAFGRAGAGAWR